MKWIKYIFLGPLALLQFIFWLSCTIQLSMIIVKEVIGVEQDVPEWMIIWYIAYFIWTNQLLIEAKK